MRGFLTKLGRLKRSALINGVTAQIFIVLLMPVLLVVILHLCAEGADK